MDWDNIGTNTWELFGTDDMATRTGDGPPNLLAVRFPSDLSAELVMTWTGEKTNVTLVIPITYAQARLFNAKLATWIAHYPEQPFQ